MTDYFTHKRMLVIFWVCVGITLSSWVLVLGFPMIVETIPFVVLIGSMFAFPTMILIPLIGSGRFEKHATKSI